MGLDDELQIIRNKVADSGVPITYDKTQINEAILALQADPSAKVDGLTADQVAAVVTAIADLAKPIEIAPDPNAPAYAALDAATRQVLQPFTDILDKVAPKASDAELKALAVSWLVDH